MTTRAIIPCKWTPHVKGASVLIVSKPRPYMGRLTVEVPASDLALTASTSATPIQKNILFFLHVSGLRSAQQWHVNASLELSDCSLLHPPRKALN